MANYLVTGAAGFIGSAIAKNLTTLGHRVITIDNLSTGIENNIPEGVEFILGDCGESSVYETIPRIKFDAIYHVAGQSSGEISFDNPIYDIRTNAESTLLLLKYALDNSCNRFIYAGSMSVYGKKTDRPINEDEDCNPESFYGVGKLASEHYMRIYQQYGINSTCLRLFNVYGPGQNLDNLRQGMISIFLAQMLEKGHILVKGSPERFRDFIYIDDVVECFIRCTQRPESYGRNINIATGRKTSVKTVIDALINAQDRNITVEYAGQTSGDVHGIYANTDLMKSILGMDKCVSLEMGIIRMVEWAKSRKYIRRPSREEWQVAN